MKSAWIRNTALLTILSISLFACRDRQKGTNTTPPAIGGKGGWATMRVVMEHDSIKVDTGFVYIKYNATTPPSDNRYDDSCAVFKVEGVPMAIFTNLNEGDYFLYGKGWDLIRSQKVTGSRPYSIPASGKYGTNQLVLQVFN